MLQQGPRAGLAVRFRAGDEVDYRVPLVSGQRGDAMLPVLVHGGEQLHSVVALEDGVEGYYSRVSYSCVNGPIPGVAPPGSSRNQVPPLTSMAPSRASDPGQITRASSHPPTPGRTCPHDYGASFPRFFGTSPGGSSMRAQ